MRGVSMARVNSITFIPSRWQSFCATGDQSNKWKHLNPPQQLAASVNDISYLQRVSYASLKIELPFGTAVREMHFFPVDRPTLPHSPRLQASISKTDGSLYRSTPLNFLRGVQNPLDFMKLQGSHVTAHSPRTSVHFVTLIGNIHFLLSRKKHHSMRTSHISSILLKVA